MNIKVLSALIALLFSLGASAQETHTNNKRSAAYIEDVSTILVTNLLMDEASQAVAKYIADDYREEYPGNRQFLDSLENQVAQEYLYCISKDLSPVYKQYFSKRDINRLAKFFATDSGKASVSTMFDLWGDETFLEQVDNALSPLDVGDLWDMDETKYFEYFYSYYQAVDFYENYWLATQSALHVSPQNERAANSELCVAHAFASLYQPYFTVKEMKKVAKFYNSPVGEKYTEHQKDISEGVIEKMQDLAVTHYLLQRVEQRVEARLAGSSSR